MVSGDGGCGRGGGGWARGFSHDLVFSGDASPVLVILVAYFRFQSGDEWGILR